MYRQIILLLTLLLLSPTLRAQTEVQPPLRTQQVIQRYRRAKNAVYVELGKDLLTRYDASYCYTLQLRPSGRELETQWSDVEQALDADRRIATVIKEQIEQGRLIGAYYQRLQDPPLPPLLLRPPWDDYTRKHRGNTPDRGAHPKDPLP